MTNRELIELHVESTLFSNFAHTMRSDSKSYKQIIEKGEEIIPDIIEYMKNNESGMNICLLLEDHKTITI